MAAVGTKALLMKGRNSGISDRLFAPAGVLASSPKAIVSQVRARVSMTNTPVAASHSSGLAVGRNPSPTATPTTSAPLIRVRTRPQARIRNRDRARPLWLPVLLGG
jgi:hypothetical protein